MSPKVRKWLVVGATALAVVVLTIFVVLFVARDHICPPALASGVITDRDWLHWDEGSRKLTALLQKRFPEGTTVSAMQDALKAEGFRPAVHEPNCATTVQVDGRSSTKCSYPADIDRRLEYFWGGIPCSQSITMIWREDRQHRIAKLSASYGGGCL
jgi:hypothetical protein